MLMLSARLLLEVIPLRMNARIHTRSRCHAHIATGPFGKGRIRGRRG
jgi:hypothetical protein